MQYDIVLPVAHKDIRIARSAIRSLLKNIDAGSIYIITARGNHHYFREFLKSGPEIKCDIKCLDENSIISGVDLQSIKQFLLGKGANPERAGWYFQQFLKMGACYLTGIADHYLIWDADSVLLKPVTFFGNDGKILIKPESEYHAHIL